MLFTILTAIFAALGRGRLEGSWSQGLLALGTCPGTAQERGLGIPEPLSSHILLNIFLSPWPWEYCREDHDLKGPRESQATDQMLLLVSLSQVLGECCGRPLELGSSWEMGGK